jgi:hypothetical protein
MAQHPWLRHDISVSGRNSLTENIDWTRRLSSLALAVSAVAHMRGRSALKRLPSYDAGWSDGATSPIIGPPFVPVSIHSASPLSSRPLRTGWIQPCAGSSGYYPMVCLIYSYEHIYEYINFDQLAQ